MDDVATDGAAFAEAVVFLGHFKDLQDPRQQGKVSYPLDEEPVAESLLAGCWCDGKGAEELGSATTGWKAALGGLPFPFVRAVPDLRGTLDRVRV